ncbi:MAG: nucleoside phosphorylase [Anaerolineaceae bacterium]|nr:nucleoside phosphorylase [Anaerolineaceae bacterium]
MEHHLPCNPSDIARYVFCPGDQKRARKIAKQFNDCQLVLENRGYVVLSGYYQDTFMTAIGTGMGGPAVAIALEELAHMGADTFLRVGSCGVFQDFQKPGDIIISNGTVRFGGTANAYLSLEYPAVPDFSMTRALVEAAEKHGITPTIGLGISSDAFYAPGDSNIRELWTKIGLVYIEMETDTLFTVGTYRRWRTAALFTSDGTATEIKPAWGDAAYHRGEDATVQIALGGMLQIAQSDEANK